MNRIIPISPEELGIYLSCQEPTLAYNLPLLIPLGKGGSFEKAKKALEEILSNHPHLNARLSLVKGEIMKSIIDTPLELKEEKVEKVDRDSLVQLFELIDSPLYRFRYFSAKDGAYLFCDFHHVLMDGFSLKMFLDEFAGLYEGGKGKKEAFDGIDDAKRKKEARENPEQFGKDKEYYQALFGGLDVDSSITIDKQDAEVHHTKIRVPLEKLKDAEVAKALKKYGVRRSSFFLSAFALMLGQATFSEEALFLTVNNGRDEKTKNSYGMFVKTLPIYVNGLAEGPVAELLKKVDKEQADNIVHSAYSYSDLVSDCGVSAEVLFSYQGDYYYHTTLGGKDVEIEVLPVKEGKEKFAIELFRDGDNFFADIEFRDDLYEEDTARNIIRRIEYFALSLLKEEKLENIAPCDEIDAKTVSFFNEGKLEGYDLDHDLLEDIERQVKEIPSQRAIVSNDKSITYGELGEVSDRIADHILSLGIKPNEVVSLLIKRTIDMPVSMVGAVKAGVGYQPLDPGYPEDRLNFMIKDAEAKLLIADRELIEKISEYKGPVLYTDEITALPRLNLPRPEYKGSDLFIMLYTSGSTGLPKGVQLERHNVSTFFQWTGKHLGLKQGSHTFAYASFGFDASMYDVYSSLTIGATLFVIDEEMRLDLKRCDEFFRKNEITHGLMTTQVGRQFTEDYDCPAVEKLLVGGEKLVPIEPPKNFDLLNVYGPTECTVFITEFKVDKLYYRVPIGKGLSISKLYVLDKKMRPLPYGVPGYLYCAGPQVGRGYKNRPEENQKAFLKNPFEGGVWSNMYYTGDVVRFLKDGTIDFIGRKDGQVKIRGFRIEMSEVERVIRDFPGVTDATVNAYPAASGGSFLAGYVVGNEKLDLDAIKAFIGERKPYYMIPEVMMQIDKIPLNQNSKVNKRALPLPERQEREVVSPANDTEKAILAIAEKVLGYQGVSVTLDLFEAGLTSISSIKFITLVSETLGCDVTTGKLRENPTIRALAAEFGKEDAQEETFEKLDDYPLTMTQQGIYVECFSDPKSTIYNIPLLYRLGKGVDLDRLVDSIKKAINAHPYLKGHLKVNDAGEPRMVPALEDEVKVEIIEGPLPEPFTLKPYVLTEGPFYQVRIYKDKNSNYLFLDTHHIASDGSALAVLMEDIETAYAGKEIPEEKRNGFMVALKEEKEGTKEAKAKQKEHYASFLDGVDCPSLPRKEYELPEDESPMEKDCILEINKADLQGFLKKNNLTINGFFNAVFAFAIAKWNGNEDALFASIYSGRNSSFVARSMTMMVKTLPVYAKIDPAQKPIDFIKALSAQIEKSEESTLYSFAEISHDFGIKAEVMFAYQGDGFLPSTVGGEKAELIHLVGDKAKAPFSVDCVEDEKAFRLHYEYPANLYREETAIYFSRLFDLIAQGLLKAKTLGEVELCDEKTAAELDVYNATDDPLPPGSYLDLFKEQVEKHPDKPAVIGIDEAITYAEMNRRMNQVARAISKLDIKPDDKIVVMVPRIANAYVARQGVLRAGACFVPVDPAYPDERILYIFEDSEAKAVLTTQKLYEEKKATYGETKFLILEDILDKEDDAPYEVKIGPHDLAYTIYTSGSTGKPKGVMIEHHSLANFVYDTEHNSITDEYVHVSSVALSLASFSFDLSIQEEYIPLANGMTVVIASEDEILNPVLLSKRMIEHKVDILTTTPSYVNNVLDIEDVMVAFRNLKVIDLGAEALPPSMIRKMREKGMNAYIQNGYGPTEATVSCTMDRVLSDRITIGFPDNNVKTYIIDQNLRRLPFGAIGELLIGGEGVARGYVHRDDLTKEKFIDYHGVYSYRSGDLARINYDGRIEFFGRKDNQVKLRGLRVELDEIENTIQSYPGVSRSVVVVKETKEEGQFLVGYYLAKEEIPVAALKEHLGKTLTPYMIPKVFMRLEAIPLTNNGKVNKKALPDPVLSNTSEGKRSIRLPKNDTQKAIYEIFQHVLGIEELSIDDDFFDLGGTSLSASKVTMLAMGKGLNISYSDVFDNPTVIDLAALALSQGKKEETKAEEVEEISEGLEHNRTLYVDEVSKNLCKFQTVLLTGATGFLGIHILHEILERGEESIIALIRGNKAITAKERLQGLLEYYFDSPYEEAFQDRIKIVESDVTSEDLLTALKEVKFDAIINCAAIVKHFAADDAIEKVNLGGVKNLIEVALDHNARLIQVSTLSIAGENINGKFPPERRIHETEIFFGQDISNKYINSKIKAEEALIEAVNTRGLVGKVVRVGNLMGRARDGEFQVNSGTNNFMATIRAYGKLGAFPVSAADATIDFSPIDEVAKTIILLAKTPKEFTIFHSANSHEVELADVIAAMNDYGYKIETVDDATFAAKLNEYMQDEKKQMDVSSLISYNSSGSETREYILSDNSFSIKALHRLGYKWPITGESYLARAIASLSTLGFFE